MTCTAATASIPAHVFHAATASPTTAVPAAGPSDMFAALLQEAAGDISGSPAPPQVPVSAPPPTTKQAIPIPAGQAAAAEAQAPEPEIPPAPPVKTPEPPVAEAPVHGKGKAIAQNSKQQTKPEQQLPAVTVLVTTAPTPPPPLPFFRKREQIASDGSSGSAASAPKAPDSEAAPQVIHTDIALQVRLKTAEQPKSVTTTTPATPEKPETNAQPKAQSASTKDDSPSDDAQSDTPRHSVPVVANAPNAVSGSSDRPPVPQPTAPATAPAPVHTPAAQPPVTVETPRPAPSTPAPAQPTAPPASATAHLQEPVPEQRAVAQPLRSVSLEFTPDGASDVKLRLSERAGEVHISVHSSDTTLSGRLHEGVHDLVGSLSSAGYEAEAWTSNQGRQGQQRPPDEEEKTKRNTPQSGSDEFAGLFRQSSQENS